VAGRGDDDKGGKGKHGTHDDDAQRSSRSRRLGDGVSCRSAFDGFTARGFPAMHRPA
jgi:hypothetical protein